MKIKAGLKKTGKLWEEQWKGNFKHWKTMSSCEIEVFERELKFIPLYWQYNIHQSKSAHMCLCICMHSASTGRTAAAFRWSSLWICFFMTQPSAQVKLQYKLWPFHMKVMPFTQEWKYTLVIWISISLQIIPTFWLTGSKGSAFHLHSHDGNSHHSWTLWHQQN